jgi:hypothetical protein
VSGAEEGAKCSTFSGRGVVIRAAAARVGGGGGGARSGFRWKKTARPADRASPPVSEGEAAGQAGPEGGRERGGPRLGQKGEGERWATAESKGGGREVGCGWARN